MGYTKYSSKYLFNKKSKFYKNEQEADCSGGFGIKGDVEERVNKENSTVHGKFLSNLLPAGKKTDYRPVIYSKWKAFLRHVIQEGDWECKRDLKDVLSGN